jgi:hypothetical protein
MATLLAYMPVIEIRAGLNTRALVGLILPHDRAPVVNCD